LFETYNMTKAAVLSRGKRSTAGRRMSTLVGKAVENDEDFWNHSTWDEGKTGAGDESDQSFHESEEDEENRVDAFDSDFNDSESEEEEGGDDENQKLVAEEEELRREERIEQGKKRKAAYRVDGGLVQKKKVGFGRTKALKGEGMNAGLVLNFPGATPLPIKVSKTLGALPRGAAAQRKYRKSVTVGTKRSLRASTITTSKQSNEARRQAAATVSSTGISRTKKQKVFTQEELILEALQVTEAENQRWILSRKRVMDEENTRAELKNKLAQNASKGKVICKMNSKRGCYNTITFPEMDFVPKIFTGNQVIGNSTLEMEKRKKANTCVITGKTARYRDPKTKMGYHDLSAFKELRRRSEAVEPLERVIVPETTLSLSAKLSNSPPPAGVPNTVPKTYTKIKKSSADNVQSKDVFKNVEDRASIVEKDNALPSFQSLENIDIPKLAPVIVTSTNKRNTKNISNNIEIPKIIPFEKKCSPNIAANSSIGILKEAFLDKDPNECLAIPSQTWESGQENVMAKSVESKGALNREESSGSSINMNKELFKNTNGVSSKKATSSTKLMDGGSLTNINGVCPSFNSINGDNHKPVSTIEENQKKKIPSKIIHNTEFKAVKKTEKKIKSTASTSCRKKQKTKKVVEKVINPSLANTSAYFANYNPPLTSHLHEMAAITPNLYHPNFTHPHLHQLVAEANQVPYQFPRSIEPSALELASLYSMSAPTALSSVAQLPLQNQQLHHTSNPLPSLSYFQPPPTPESSANMVRNILLPYNITSTGNSREQSSKQEKKYHVSKNNDNQK